MHSKRWCLVFFLCICYGSLNSQTFTINDTTGLFRKLNSLSNRYLAFDLVQPFDSIINQIYNNSELTVDTVIVHSDSSAFYLRAYHKNFNPFTIPLDSVRLIIAEIRRFDIETKDPIDTVFYLQTEGIATGEEEIKNIRARFYKLEKELMSSSWHSNYGKTKVNKVLTAESFTYYFSRSRMPVANITWRRTRPTQAVIVVSLELQLQNPLY